MIKEKLMKALKCAADDFNSGMSANDAVAKAASDADFNEKQAERLTEMFNTAVALNKEKDASDPTGMCELAEKTAVAKLLIKGSDIKKEASHQESDYSFYNTAPGRTNPAIEARASGRSSMCKAASAGHDEIPAELNVSQRSLYKIIEGKIDILKSASAAADDVVRNLRLDIDQKAIKIAKAVESPYADPEMADMFKAACEHKAIVDMVSEYSTKMAESDGGRFSRMNVFDTSKVDELLKIAEEMNGSLSSIAEYENKREMYMSKAAEAHEEVLGAVGFTHKEVSASTLADMFQGSLKEAGHSAQNMDGGRVAEDGDDKVAEVVADMLEKVGGLETLSSSIPSVGDAYAALMKSPGIDDEKKRIINIRRSMLLADLLTNDPIIRDADPNVVAEAYKTMVMASPRVSLDKAQVRAFLRSAVNSVAISPNEAKVISDVDKGIALSNMPEISRIHGLSAMDSSIKDSNA